MLQRSDLEVAIPSSGRAKRCWQTMRTLLPMANVYVAEREVDDYRSAGIPAERIRTHPNLEGMGAIRNHLVQDARKSALVCIDDDLRFILCRVGRKPRKIAEPERIFDIMYGSALVASEIPVAMFGWGVQAMPWFYRDSDPMTLCGAFGGAVGFIGKTARYDDRLKVGEDVDVILRELRERRIVFSDKRYYWNFGKVMGGAGGLQAVRSEERCRLDRELLKAKWGESLHLLEDRPGVHCRLRVKRRQAWTE